MRRFLAIGALMLAVGAPRADAQAVKDCQLNQIEADTAAAWQVLAPSRIKARLAYDIANNRWADAADSLRIIFSSAPASWAGLDAAMTSVLVAQLDSLRADMLLRQRDPAHVILDRFRLVYVAPTNNYQIFRYAGGTPVTVDDATDPTLRRTICRLGLAGSDLVAGARSAQIAKLAAAFAAVDKSWDNYLNHGYSMLPLELFVNGQFIKRARLEPPTQQIIIAHVSAAEQMFVRSLHDASRNDVLALEPLGWLWYGKGNASYFGLSSVVTYPASGGIGLGGMIHSSSLGHAGVVWQRMPDRTSRVGGMISIDLYQRITSTTNKLAQFKTTAIANCVADKACASAHLVP